MAEKKNNELRTFHYREYVVQKNDLIQRVRNNLNERELKLLDFMISQITAKDDKLYSVSTSISQINKFFRYGDGGKNLQLTRDALMNMHRKSFWFRDEEKETTETVSWLDKVIISDNGEVELKLDKTLAPYLVGMLNEKFTKYPIIDIVNLKGKNTVLMYKLMQSKYLGKRMAFEMTREEVLAYFNKENMAWGPFNQKVMKPAIEKINGISMIHIDYELITKGRKILKVRFIVDEFSFNSPERKEAMLKRAKTGLRSKS